MALQSRTITVGADKDVNNGGKNYVSGQVIYIKDEAGVLAPIFRDIDGLDPIAQNTISNVTNAKGQFTFFIEEGNYTAEYNDQSTPLFVFGADYFNNQIDFVTNQILSNTQPYSAGNFTDGFAFTELNQYGNATVNDGGTDYATTFWYIGGTLPHTVAPLTNPRDFPLLYQQRDFNSAEFVATKTTESAQDFIDSFALKIFQSPTDGLTEINTRTLLGGEVYEVRKVSDNSLADIYSDKGGLSPITQDGTSNVSGSDGVVEFYIDDGSYKIDVGASSEKFNARKRNILNFENVSSMLSGEPSEGDRCSTGGSLFVFEGGDPTNLDSYALTGVADATDFIADLTDDTANAAILADLIVRYNKITIPYGYDVLSSDIAVTTASDTDFQLLGNLYFTGDVAASYTPIAFNVSCGGYDFKIGGGGYLDFQNHSAPIIRRRLLNVSGAGDAKVYGYKTRSCKCLIQAFTGNVSRVRFKSPETTVHQADGTGLIGVNFSQGGNVEKNTLVANIDNQAEVVDIIKVTGGTPVVEDASKSVNVKDNFVKNIGGGNAELDVFSGGRECTIDNNTLINVSVQTKNNYVPESIANNHIILSKNKFLLDEDGMTLCIYRRSGKIKILDNFFIARSDQTLMDSVINLDKEEVNTAASKDDQGDIIINGNICDMRAITADNSTFSFVLTDTLAGTDLDKLHCIFSDNIVRGCNGLMRGNMFSNSVCRGGVFDMAGKTSYSTGNFTFKKIDGLTTSADTPYLLTNTPTVQNSPRVAMRNYYSDAALSGGNLDIKERDVFVLTDGNLNSETYIDAITNHTIRPFVVINRSSSTVTFSLTGDQSRALPALGQMQIMPYNDSDFTESRIRFKATIF